VRKRRCREAAVDPEDSTFWRSRRRQIRDLHVHALITTSAEFDDDDSAAGVLELMVKEVPRGAGYVCDFVYTSPELPVTVAGVLTHGRGGLEVAELELFRIAWGYYDEDGLFVGLNSSAVVSHAPSKFVRRKEFTGITSALLRRIPIGSITDRAQRILTAREWKTEDVRIVGYLGITRSEPFEDLDESVRNAVMRAQAAVETAKQAGRRGRPRLPDELLAQVAVAYLDEVTRGRGLMRRLAERFNRPEETLRDWVQTARRRGWLSEATPGRRGAMPGPRLQQALEPRGDERA
jgi:transposase-like protein